MTCNVTTSKAPCGVLWSSLPLPHMFRLASFRARTAAPFLHPAAPFLHPAAAETEVREPEPQARTLIPVEHGLRVTQGARPTRRSKQSRDGVRGDGCTHQRHTTPGLPQLPPLAPTATLTPAHHTPASSQTQGEGRELLHTTPPASSQTQGEGRELLHTTPPPRPKHGERGRNY